MTRELTLHPEAEADLDEAFLWYESKHPGHGSDFLTAIDASLQAILLNPLQFPVIYKTLRRALTRRFPYQVFYTMDDTRIVVLAVIHAKRSPRYWRQRAV